MAFISRARATASVVSPVGRPGYASLVPRTPWATEVDRLVRHAEYLRQINSNKAFRLDRRNRWLTVLTVVVAAAVTFVGFSGTDRLTQLLRSPLGWSKSAVELGYNVLILLLLLFTIVSLIYRLPQRIAAHYQAVSSTTVFIRAHEGTVRLDESGVMLATTQDEANAQRDYRALTASLPPNTDKEYLRAKRDYKRKRSNSPPIRDLLADLLRSKFPALPKRSGTAVPESVESLLDGQSGSSSSGRSDVLSALDRAIHFQGALALLSNWHGPQELWLTGGIIRNVVWDQLHAYAVPTFPDDIDVIYYDESDQSKDSERAIEQWLAGLAPNLKWDVKNQARFRGPSDRDYQSLEDALRHFPETASAVAIRRSGSAVEILAPYGLVDLVGMVVRKPQIASQAAFERRTELKSWSRFWPKIWVDNKPCPN